MHVLLFGPVPPPHGGVQTHLMALAGFLRGAGARVSIMNITRHRKAEQNGEYYPTSVGGVLARMAQLRADVLHIHLGGNLALRGLGLCALCGLWPGAVSVMTFHSGGYPTSPAGRAARPDSMAGRALRSLDHLIAVNPEIEDLFHQFGVPAARTSVIEPHSDTPPPSGEPLPPMLAEFVARRRPLLVAVGGLEPEYCVPLQIEAMAAIVSQLPEAGLVVIGTGAQEQEVRARAAVSPVRDHILLAGDVPHRLTLRAIAEADLFLRITAYDGDSLSVREALSLGVPVLASDNGMRPSGVQLVSPLSPESVARRTIEVVTAPPPSRRVRSGPEGDPNLGQVVELYQRLRSGRG